MGCGDRAKRDSPDVVQIGTTRSTRVTTKRSTKKKVAIGDFHCGECLLSLHRRPENYYHNCPGYKESTADDPRREYQRLRKTKCDPCQHNVDGICEIEKQAHPDRPCVIEIGIRKPYAYCKIGEWDKVEDACPICTINLFDSSGVTACRYCGWAEDSWSRVEAGWSIIPEMHDDPSPKNKYAIVTIAIGPQAEELGRKTIPQMERYAERCGADMIVIRDDQSPEYVLGNKFRVGAYASAYERTLFLDADVYVRDETPDVFATYEPGAVYAHNDSPFLRDENWLRGEAYELSKSQHVDKQDLTCINTGVVLCDREHASIWSQLPKQFRRTHTSEQSWVEMNLRSSSFEYRELPVELNTQWWFRGFQELSSAAHMVHLANCPHKERLFLVSLIESGVRELPKTKVRP